MTIYKLPWPYKVPYNSVGMVALSRLRTASSPCLSCLQPHKHLGCILLCHLCLNQRKMLSTFHVMFNISTLGGEVPTKVLSEFVPTAAKLVHI